MYGESDYGDTYHTYSFPVLNSVENSHINKCLDYPAFRHLLSSPPSTLRPPPSSAFLTSPPKVFEAMRDYVNPSNGYALSLPGLDSPRMPPPSSTNASTLSAAMLTDPKILKRHFTNVGSGRNNQVAFQPPMPPSFNPRQLLSPREYTPTQHTKGLNNTTDSGPNVLTPKIGLEEENGQGMGSLIERLHNVSQRGEPPQKRLKAHQTGTENGATAFVGGGKGGEIGEYMKQKRDESLITSGPAPVVDLTETDDDDVVFLRKTEDKEVCYGRLDSTKVQAHLVPDPGPEGTVLSPSGWPAMKLQLQRGPDNSQIVRVLDPSGIDFGNVDTRTAQGLTRIMDSATPVFRTQARLNVRRKKPGETPGDWCSEYMDMTINVYGPKSQAGPIGRFLTNKQLYLRNPFIHDPGIEVCNPHVLNIGGLPRSLAGISSLPGSSSGHVTRTAEEIRSDVLGMFNSLKKSESLPEMEPSELVTTKLLPHQKQGLHFMTNKEKHCVFSEEEEDNSSLWRLKYKLNGQRTYYNVITGGEERTKPPEVLGGILADMMGLGKTLSILSLIVGSLNEAAEWAKQAPVRAGEVFHLVRNSKATLLVAPLSTVANWEEQIAMHLKPGALKYYIFHGGHRIQDIDRLAEFDLIITTYSIISSERKKKDASSLLRTNFFRIALDEAHMIREQSTQQCQTICALSSNRRWAVTGTPVQNRLDDLGALVKFLRVKPFNDKGGFAQFILTPFKMADPEILPKLRLLVDTITLRRLKDKIDLPPHHDHIVRLQFSDDEKKLYQWFARDSDQKMKIIARDSVRSLSGKSYVHILQAIMRLRLLCAHGRELLSQEDLKMTEGSSSNNAIDIEEDEEKDTPAISSRQAYDMLMLFRETDADKCVQCTQVIGPSDSENTAKSDTIGYILPCFQIVCRDCMRDLKSSLEQRLSRDHFICPFCDQYLRTSFFELTQSGIEAAEEAKNAARETPRQAKVMGQYGGPHTKTKALIECLHNSSAESQLLPKDKPIKSVIFSGWTAHLDLIQIALEDNGIKYVRLDGKMSRTKRTASVDAFRDDPEVLVFLVSISAGGLGLNLTAGSRVYVMEPQYNPAAEAQAVDRVYRLGQTREVFTTRFIMGDSFEEKMLILQRKKQNLADLSLNRGKIDRHEATKQKLEELRSLFK